MPVYAGNNDSELFKPDNFGNYLLFSTSASQEKINYVMKIIGDQ
jgi:hypothetical protein